MKDRPGRTPNCQWELWALHFGVEPTPSCSLCGPLTDQNGETCFKQEGSYIFLILYVALCQLIFQYKAHSPSFYRRGSCLCPNVVGRHMWRGHTAQRDQCSEGDHGAMGQGGDPSWTLPIQGGLPKHRVKLTWPAVFAPWGSGEGGCQHKGKSSRSRRGSLRLLLRSFAWGQTTSTLVGREPTSWKITVCLMWKRMAFGQFNSQRQEQARQA